MAFFWQVFDLISLCWELIFKYRIYFFKQFWVSTSACLRGVKWNFGTFLTYFRIRKFSNSFREISRKKIGWWVSDFTQKWIAAKATISNFIKVFQSFKFPIIYRSSRIKWCLFQLTSKLSRQFFFTVVVLFIHILSNFLFVMWQIDFFSTIPLQMLVCTCNTSFANHSKINSSSFHCSKRSLALSPLYCSSKRLLALSGSVGLWMIFNADLSPKILSSCAQNIS